MRRNLFWLSDDKSGAETGVIPSDLVVCERWTRGSTRRVRVRSRQLCDVALLAR